MMRIEPPSFERAYRHGAVLSRLGDALDRWENEGGLVTRVQDDPGPTTKGAIDAFPSVRSGVLELTELEIVRLLDTRALGKYRVQRKRAGGHVFVVTLFGSTCSKVELVTRTHLDWNDYLRAMKRAIEREIGYRMNRGAARPVGDEGPIDVIVRDTDFFEP